MHFKTGCFALLLCFFTFRLTAQVSSGTLEAAYIYNFAKYIQWPEFEGNFTIGVYGNSEVAQELQEIVRNKRVNSKSIEILSSSRKEELLKCKIIFLPKSESGKLDEILQIIGNKDILLVTENDLANRGASISFFIDNQRLRIKLNQVSVRKQRLTVSEGLLKMAVLL